MTDLVLALDVGGTYIKSAVLDERMTVVDRGRHPTEPHEGPDAVVERILSLLEQLCSSEPGCAVTRVGIVVPGIVDVARGTAISSANLGWRNVPIRELARARVDRPIAFGQDVRAGALAEAHLGASRHVSSSVFVPIGTGLGAAVVLGDELLDLGPFAGELGHLSVGGEEICSCGARGCLETIASAGAIPRRYHRLTTEAPGPVPATDPPSLRDVLARADDGDVNAVRVWQDAVAGLTAALASVVSLVSPEVIVLGGGLVVAAPDLPRIVEKKLDETLTFQPRPAVLPSSLGDLAGCLGAGLLARAPELQGR